jgi:SPP1 gp7 family putative phage head morphogenesis protein
MHEVNGFPVPDDARCPQCGSTLIAPIGLDNWRCQNCHAEWISLPQGMMMQQPKASVVSRPSEPRGQMYSHECGLEKGHGIIARSKDWTVKKWLAKDYAPDLQKMLVLVKAAEFSDITDLNSRQKEKLREVLAWALETDAKLKDVENKVYSIVRDKARAEVIARTELSRVSTESDLDKYEEHGVKKVEWNAVPDEKCCDECWEKNGNEYSLAKAANLIPAHPCCRCLFIAVE